MRALFCCFILGQICLAQVDQSTIAAHSEKAGLAQQRGDFKTAAQEWKAITKLSPSIAEAYSNLGMMYHFDRQYPRAIGAFSEASKLNPKLIAPQLFLGIDYYLTAQAREAIPYFKAALALSPNDSTALKWLGMSYYQLGDFQEALGELALASQTSPQDSDLLFYQSRAYSRLLFKSHEAIRRIDADSPYLKALRDEKAPLPFEGPDVAAVRGDFQSNHFSEALEQAKKLITHSPQSACSWYWFGKSSEALALEALDHFLAASPDSYRVDQLKAEYALASGDDDGAMNEFRLALSRTPDALQLHESLGNIFMSRHEYDRAIPEYEAEIRINPYALVSLERIGQAYAELHEPTNAAGYLNRALTIDPHAYEALRALGKVDFEQGDYSNAAKHYSLAVQINGEAEPAILFQLSRTYKELGNPAEAARWLARFRQALATRTSSAERAMNQTSSRTPSHP
jgi:tetratricopeptide (TPR) repeat protein